LAEKLERLWNVVNNQRRALCIFGDWSRYALGAPARDGWSEVIRDYQVFLFEPTEGW